MSISRIQISAVLAAVGIIVSTLLFSGTTPRRDTGDGRGDAVSAARGIGSSDRPGEETFASREARTIRSPAITRSEASIALPGSRSTGMITTSSPVRCDERCRDDLARARAATERYWRVSAALSDGFVEVPGCQTTPQGAVGIQYANLARSADQHVDAVQPESLLYMPEGVGEARRLVAVEYSDPILTENQDPPRLFGRQFEPADDGFASVYRLRVWLFSDNPAGLFAPANPAEGCTAAGLVAPDLTVEGCHEVHGIFDVDVELLREAGVPGQFRLRGQEEDGGGTAELLVGGFACDAATLAGGATAPSPLLFTHVEAMIDPPNWGPFDLFGVSRYEFRVFVNDSDVAKTARRLTGMDQEVITHSPDLVRVVTPMEATTDLTDNGSRCATVCDYRFESPDFLLTATINDALPTVPTASLHFLRETPRGLGSFNVLIDDLGLGAANVLVTPVPGTTLARLLNCETNPCVPVRPKRGAVATFDGALTWTLDAD